MITFYYRLPQAGWINAEISNDGDHASLTASYLTDAVRDLTEAIVALMRGAAHRTCTWQEEPGEYEWRFDRHEDDVQIAILWFDFRGKTDSGKIIFLTQCTLKRFANQVLNQLWRLLNDMDLDEYKVQWRHDFPLDKYKELERLIRNKAADNKKSGSDEKQ